MPMTGPQPLDTRDSTLNVAFGDRYSIERELGRGGMGTVYLAEERKHARKVAIKVLRLEPGATPGSDRFLREIGIAARLSHPYIVPLIDSGEAAGFLYYVAAYVPGGTLRDRLRREGKLSIADSMRIAQEIAAALDYAHRNGFVHRDVKPENILFADDHAQLADFGVALACTPAESGTITAAGTALGTPEYMSPEQASGAASRRSEDPTRERRWRSRSRLRRLRCARFARMRRSPWNVHFRALCPRIPLSATRRQSSLRPSCGSRSRSWGGGTRQRRTPSPCSHS